MESVRMQALDIIYTHNAYQGIFQIAYDQTQFSDANTFVFVTRIIQKWIVKKFGDESIPDKPRNFRWNRVSRSVDIIYEYDKLFYCARIVHADNEVANRTWTTEVEVSKSGNKLLIGTKVQYTSDSPAKDYHLASIPSFIRKINNRVRLYDAGKAVDQLFIIASQQDLELLCCVIGDDTRSCPVIVISENGSLDPDIAPFFEVDKGYHVDGNKLANSLQFLAHVYYLPLTYQSEFCNMLGSEWGTYNGAIRTYYPGFLIEDREGMNAYDHPFITTGKILPMNYINDAGKEYIAGHAFRHILTHRIKIDNMTSRIDWNKNGISLYYKANRRIQAASENDIEELRELSDYYCEQFDLKESERLQYEQERDEVREQLKNALSINIHNQQRIFTLEKKLKELNANPPMIYPSSYDEIVQWVIENFSGRIELHKRAVKCLKDNPVYPDVVLLCKAIELLGTTYYDMKMGFLGDKTVFDQCCNQLKVENSATGSVASAGTQGKSYEVDYQGSRRRLDMHLKGGKSMNSHDDRERFRIYYFWDDDSNRIVIGHLPGHLHTNQS